MLNIGVVGANGRMGQMLIAEVIHNNKTKLIATTEKAGGQLIGQDIGLAIFAKEIGVIVSDNADDMFKKSDVVIDFSHASITKEHILLAKKHATKLVIGTTGLSEDTLNAIDEAAQDIAIVQAGNMSLGVNILLGLTKKLASLLDNSWDIEILEMHHKNKVDAPSGTALMLGNAAKEGREEASECFTRHGMIGARASGEIGYATLRGGSVIGNHDVIFAGADEMITISHQAQSRLIFAKGAVAAAIWLSNKERGRYDMLDVLDLKS